MSAMPNSALDGWKERQLAGFFQLVGPLWTRKEGDSWGYAFLAQEKHANPAGMVHGGMLTTLLDHALSALAWEANARKPCVTVALDVHFLQPARPGDFIEARGRILRQTSSLVFLQGGLSVQERDIAAASAILKIRSP